MQLCGVAGPGSNCVFACSCVLSLILGFNLPNLLSSNFLGLYNELNTLCLLTSMCGNYSPTLYRSIHLLAHSLVLKIGDSESRTDISNQETRISKLGGLIRCWADFSGLTYSYRYCQSFNLPPPTKVWCRSRGDVRRWWNLIARFVQPQFAWT